MTAMVLLRMKGTVMILMLMRILEQLRFPMMVLIRTAMVSMRNVAIFSS